MSTKEFFTYLAELLEDPGRSGTGIFDQQRYVMATKECLQLYLCNHQNFSMGTMESALCDKALHRHKPSAWIARLGVHSRIQKGQNYVKVQQHKPLKAWEFFLQYSSFPEKSPGHEYYRSLSYKVLLRLLPFMLEKSAISSELADVLSRCTFMTMAQRFPEIKVGQGSDRNIPFMGWVCGGQLLNCRYSEASAFWEYWFNFFFFFSFRNYIHYHLNSSIVASWYLLCWVVKQ